MSGIFWSSTGFDPHDYRDDCLPSMKKLGGRHAVGRYLLPSLCLKGMVYRLEHLRMGLQAYIVPNKRLRLIGVPCQFTGLVAGLSQKLSQLVAFATQRKDACRQPKREGRDQNSYNPKILCLGSDSHMDPPYSVA